MHPRYPWERGLRNPSGSALFDVGVNPLAVWAGVTCRSPRADGRNSDIDRVAGSTPSANLSARGLFADRTDGTPVGSSPWRANQVKCSDPRDWGGGRDGDYATNSSDPCAGVGSSKFPTLTSDDRVPPIGATHPGTRLTVRPARSMAMGHGVVRGRSRRDWVFRRSQPTLRVWPGSRGRSKESTRPDPPTPLRASHPRGRAFCGDTPSPLCFSCAGHSVRARIPERPSDQRVELDPVGLGKGPGPDENRSNRRRPDQRESVARSATLRRRDHRAEIPVDFESSSRTSRRRAGAFDRHP